MNHPRITFRFTVLLAGQIDITEYYFIVLWIAVYRWAGTGAAWKIPEPVWEMMIWSRKQERGLLDKIPEPNVKEKRRRRWNRKPHPRGKENETKGISAPGYCPTRGNDDMIPLAEAHLRKRIRNGPVKFPTTQPEQKKRKKKSCLVMCFMLNYVFLQ